MLLGKRIQNFRMLAQMEIPKNRGELYMKWIFLSPKNWKKGENTEIFSKIETQNISIICNVVNVIRKEHTKFEEASSIRNNQKSRATIQWHKYFKVQKLEIQRKYRKFSQFEKPKIWVLGNVIRKAHTKYPKSDGNCTMTWILHKSKNWKNGENSGNFF